MIIRFEATHAIVIIRNRNTIYQQNATATATSGCSSGRLTTLAPTLYACLPTMPFAWTSPQTFYQLLVQSEERSGSEVRRRRRSVTCRGGRVGSEVVWLRCRLCVTRYAVILDAVGSCLFGAEDANMRLLIGFSLYTTQQYHPDSTIKSDRFGNESPV